MFDFENIFLLLVAYLKMHDLQFSEPHHNFEIN